VAGVPGRIFDVKGRATVPADPEFGVSEHVAGVLLAARRHGADVSAGINITYEQALLDELAEQGHVVAAFDESDDISSSVGAAIEEKPRRRCSTRPAGWGSNR